MNKRTRSIVSGLIATGSLAVTACGTHVSGGSDVCANTRRGTTQVGFHTDRFAWTSGYQATVVSEPWPLCPGTARVTSVFWAGEGDRVLTLSHGGTVQLAGGQTLQQNGTGLAAGEWTANVSGDNATRPNDIAVTVAWSKV
jgi:hypothetical protein